MNNRITGYQSPSFGVKGGGILKKYVKPTITEEKLGTEKTLCSWWNPFKSEPEPTPTPPPSIELWWDDPDINKYRRLGYDVKIKH